MSADAYKPSPQQDVPQRSRRAPLIPLILALVGIVLLGAGGALLLLDRSSSAVASAPLVGRQLADFTLTDLSGKEVRLSDYAGRPVLINAWATWCPPCQAELPGLQQLYERHQAEGFAILGVDAGEDPAIVKSYVEQFRYTFPVLLDPQARLLERWGIRDYPTSIVVGRDGKVKLLQVGLLTTDAIQKVIEPLISQ